MRLVLTSALAALAPASAMAQPAEELNLYPALSHAGVAYVIRADDGGRIVKCQPLDPATAPETARAGCASLTAKGVPATVSPARPKVLPRMWNDQRDLPDEDRRARRGGKVEMIFEVDEQGRMAGCNVYRSSGVTGADRAACAGVLARARFSPATFKGQPTRAIGTMEYSFRP